LPWGKEKNRKEKTSELYTEDECSSIRILCISNLERAVLDLDFDERKGLEKIEPYHDARMILYSRSSNKWHVERIWCVFLVFSGIWL
jgi:hypothetical protein